MNNLASNIKANRKAKKISQEELAEYLEVTRTVISKYENKKLEPNINTLIKLSKAFNISIDTLIND